MTPKRSREDSSGRTASDCGGVSKESAGAEAGAEAGCSPRQLDTHELQLVCRDGTALAANKHVLMAASPVLRESLTLALPRPGALELLEDGAEEWGTVLQMIGLGAYPLLLVNWDNVEPLLRLADKYDMALTRGSCADFLARGASALSLDPPLTSPKNLLRAASLVEWFCAGQPLEAFAQAMNGAFGRALAAFHSNPLSESAARPVAAKLQVLVTSGGYAREVAPGVQAKVLLALVRGMCSLPAAPPPNIKACATCFCTAPAMYCLKCKHCH